MKTSFNGSDVTLTLDGNRVTHIEVQPQGWFFVDPDGATSTTHGNQISFDVTGFHLVGNTGILLTSKPGMEGITTVTLTTDCPVSCFAEGTMILMSDCGAKPIEQIDVGDELWVMGGSTRVLWVGSRTVEITEQTQPYDIDGLTVSPQHRVTWLAKGGLVAAKHHPCAHPIDLGVSQITYWHILTDRHAIVEANGIWAETLWPGGECMKMLGTEIGHLIDVEEYLTQPAGPFLNKHGRVKA